MRKWMTLLLSILLLAGCAAEEAEEAAVPELFSPEVAVEEVQPEIFTYRVKTGVWEDAAQDDDGTLLVSYRFLLPELQVLQEDGTTLETADTDEARAAAETAEAFNRHFGKWAAAEEFPEIADSAAADLALSREWESEWAGPYELELICDVYQTEGLVSVAGTYYSFTGGAHPNTWQLGWNFDLENGNFFGPEGLAADSAAFQEAIVAELVRQAGEIAAENGMVPEEMFWQDYESILANWSSYAVSFDENGMTVVFSPYELAAYAYGPQEFSFSYDWLLPHLSDHGRQVLGLSGT